jgi:hypothetical protein
MESKSRTPGEKTLKSDLTSWNPSEALASARKVGVREIKPFFMPVLRTQWQLTGRQLRPIH